VVKRPGFCEMVPEEPGCIVSDEYMNRFYRITETGKKVIDVIDGKEG